VTGAAREPASRPSCPRSACGGLVSAELPLADPANSDGNNTPAAEMALVVLDQRFDADTLYLLRVAVLAHAAATGMPEQGARDVVLAVHELAANVVRHGTGAGRLVMRIAAGTLRCTVEDAGAPAGDGHTNAGAPDNLTQPGSDRAAGPWPYLPGHGLWLARQVADQMTVADLPVGSQVTVAFLLPDAGDAAAQPWPGVRRAGRQGRARR